MASGGATDVFISTARSDGDAAAELNSWRVPQGSGARGGGGG